EVRAYDDFFDPGTINVQPGTTVVWVNQGRHNHTATSLDEAWDSGDIAPGRTYSVTFDRPGTFRYFCRHHTQERMEGTVVVATPAAVEVEVPAVRVRTVPVVPRATFNEPGARRGSAQEGTRGSVIGIDANPVPQ